MIIKNRGQLLEKEELKEIANNFILSEHAKLRISQRFPTLNIRKCILNPVLAYWNTDGSINIALNRFEYLVFVKKGYKFLIVTFKEKSHNGIDIFQKRKLALAGYSRKLI